MITVENLTYIYPEVERPVLRDVSLTIPAGEFVLLTGPSGAGKSTLLRTFSGLVPHFSGGTIAGRIRVAGKDPVADGPQQMSRTVGMVFQNPEAQSVVDRVEADVAFALENAAVPPGEMRIRVEEALNLLELTPLRDRALHTLSGGERQRAAIAAALALRPRVLVLDEPTSQLDPQAAADVLGALARLNEDLGLTIVLCEHRLERVVRYAERVVALEQGVVVADGPVPDILERLP
ncbi:MAG: energy-coupling factor ABC transporter ATP-binding protein, partial [Chloroflexota bacterium]